MAIDITTAVAQIRSAQLGIDVREAIAQGLEVVSEDAATSAESVAESVNDIAEQAAQTAEQAAQTAEQAAQTAEQAAQTAEQVDTKLDKIIKSANLFNPEAIEEGYAQSGVNKMENADYFITEQIHVDVSKGNLFCGVANEDGTLTAQVMRFALFVSTDGVTKYLTQKATTVEIPTDTAYFVATFPNTVKDSQIYIGYGDTCEGVTYQPYGEFDVLATLKNTNAKTLENTEQVNTLTAIDNGKISSIMKPLFTDGANLQIKLIGDSITMGAQGTGVNDADENNDLIYETSTRGYYENTAGHCWANSLRDYFAEKFGCTVKNYGVTGSTSWAILNYIDNIVRDEDDICIVCIGTNDRQKATKDETKTRIKGIYDAITAKGKRCILMSPIPMSATNEAKYDERDYHANDVDIIYQSIASELNIEYIPLYKLLNQYITSHGITLDSILASDLIHPNDNGYDIIFGLVSNALGVPTRFENPADDMTFAELNAKFVNANSELAETKEQLTNTNAQLAQTKEQLAETQAEFESLKVATETVEEAAATATEQANIATQKATEIAESAEQIGTNTSDISELKSDLNNIAIINNVVSDNLIDISKNTVGYQLNTSGNPIVNENYTISDYIAINPETQYWVGRIYNEKVYHGAIQRTCFYTSDKQFISYIGDSGYTDGIITTPANAMYIRLAFSNSTYSDNTMMIIENNAPDGYVEYFLPFKSIEIKPDILPYSDIMNRANIEEIRKHPLYGKKVTWYGDSIIKNTWWQPISELFDMTSINCGVGGTTICGTTAVSSACMNLQSRMLGDYGNIVDENNGDITYDGVAIPLDTDFIIIGGGTNDWAQNKALGEKALPITDESSEITPTTFYYACHEMFKNIGLLFPNARVIVLGAPFGKHNNREQFTNKYGIVNNQGLTSIDYGNALCDIAEQWGHIALRYGNGMGINDSNVETLLDPTLQGHLHPTTETAQKLFVNATLNGLLNIRY